MKRLLSVAAIVIGCLNPFVHTRALADTPVWNSIPGPAGGSVAALAMSPNYAVDRTVFAGLRGHGVYRSTDGGSTWHPTGLLDQVVVDVVVSPNFAVDHTLFAGTGLGPGGYQVYHSTDGGTTWQAPYVTPYSDGFKPLIGLSISPNYSNDHTVYALGATEMYKSTDGGLVFSKMGGWYATHHVTALAFSSAFATDHTVFAAVQNNGIMKSVDGGGIWNATLFDATGTFSALAISPDYPADLTVAAIHSSNGQLCLSSDGGTNMHCVSLFLGAGDKHTLLFSPTFAADRLMLAASSGDPGPYRSSDGGETWTPVGWSDFVGGSIVDLAIPPNTIENDLTLAGTGSGLYLSRSRGQFWEQHNTGLLGLTLRTFAIAPNNPDRLLAGTSYFDQQHFNSAALVEAEGSLQLSQDGGRSWRDVSGRIDRVRRVAFSPNVAIDHTAFACAGIVGQDGYTGGGIYRSTDDAQNWSALIEHAACNDLALSPDYPLDHTAWAYVQGQGLLRTTNGGDAWTSINNDFVAELLLPSPNYATDQTLFASTSDSRLLKSIDGGATWAPVLYYTITSLAISPAYGASQTLYAGVKETANSSGAIYRSGDGGALWQKLTTGIPSIVNNQSATISAIEFATDGSMVVGVIYGNTLRRVYRSNDGGQTWQTWGDLSDDGLFDLISQANSGENDERGAFTFVAGTAHALNWRDQQQRDPAEPGVWETTGPRGGRADTLAISPNFVDDGLALTGESNWFRFSSQYGLGIFKTTDWGQTWNLSNNGLEDPAQQASGVNGFAFSPNFAADQTAFYTTWGGIFKSTDGAESWQLLASGIYDAVAVAPNYPASGHMLARGVYGCLYRSTDFGWHWSYDCSLQFPAMAYSPEFATDNTIFVASNGISESVDGGLTWTSIFTASVYEVAVSPQYGLDHTLFAKGDALYRSTDGGTTWISLTVGLGLPVISPNYASDHTLFAAGGDLLYRSDDGGLNWNVVPNAPHEPIGPIAISPGWPAHPYLLVGTVHGVYRSTDGGMTWAQAPGFTPLAARPLELSSDDALWLGGTGRGVFSSADRGQTWSPFGTLSAAINDLALSPAYTTDHTLFVTTSCDGCGGMNIRRTMDGGATWQIVRSINGSGEMAISPQYASDHTLYAIGSGVWRSSNGGDNWESIGTWPPFAWVYQHIALPPNYPADSTVFAAGPGFWRLPPGETVWQSAASGILSNTNISALAVTPNYSQSHTLLATSVEYPDVNPHSAVFRSEDGGVTWQHSDVGLPNAEWRSIAFSPHYADDHTVYLASSQQLYRSVDEGRSWTPVAAPPDGVWLNAVTVSHAGDVIVSSDAGVQLYRTGFRDVLINGEAEALSGWSLSPDGAAYATEINFHAQQALRLGLTRGNNHPIDSSAAQTVTIPISATLAQLNLRLYPASSEATIAPHDQSAASGDAQYVSIAPSGTGTISPTLLWMLSNTQTWQRYSFDLTPYAGQTIEVRVGVINDGEGGQTALYLDSASLITLGANGHKVFLPVMLK